MKKAFTLIELLVVVAIVAILAALIYPVLGGCGQRTAPEETMREHLATLFPDHEIVGITCMQRDSDGDGYISCSASLKDKQGRIFTRDAECSSWYQNGCRAPKPNFTNQY